MGGLGKTTLAKNISNHPAVKGHFDCFSWTCISQQWQIKDVLQRILLNLRPGREDEVLSLRDTAELAKQISDSLKVAQRLGLEEGNLLYEPEILNGEQSRELLKKKTCITKYRHTDRRDVLEFEKLGREMLRRCNGLPLAILVLGGILATKPTLTQWEMVHKELGTGQGLGQVHQKEVEDVLISSYYDLPDQLKPCFMYLSKFPEDTDIEAERLYQLWMAVGMVSSKDQRDGETMMDVAESYPGELSNRCMVQVEVEDDESSNSKFRSCRLHDVMRDLCLRKAEEEDFFRVIGNVYKHGQSRSRVIARTNISSEFCFPLSVVDDFHPKNLKYLSLLLVEDFELAGLDIHEHMMISNILELRYLSLRFCGQSVFLLFTYVILEHLQTLDLRWLTLNNITELPGMLRNMGRRMQHLYLPDTIRVDTTNEKLRLDDVANLELLENFDPSWCETKDLFKLANLLHLTIHMLNNCDVEGLEEVISYLQSSQASYSLGHSRLVIKTNPSIRDSENGRSALRQLWDPNTNLQRLVMLNKLKLPTNATNATFTYTMIPT